MSVVSKIHDRAKADVQHIVLPEGEEPRTIRAAEMIIQQGIAKLTLVGDEQVIADKARELGVSLEGVAIENPKTSPKRAAYAEMFYELRKNKGMTPEKADAQMQDPVYFGTMMLKMDEVDGLVSGAIHSTGDTLRPSLQIIKTAPGVKVVSSFFLMEKEGSPYGEDGVMLYADSGLNIDPTAEEVAAIAISTAHSAQELAGITPKVAMLSFSTKGSAKHPMVDKMQEATLLAQQMAPDMLIDGELQGDAALVESVGKLKSPGSPVAGHANVLIFPDLQAGNIAYKLTERLGGFTALGPLCQGMAKPVNDLSRGCSAEDIVSVVAITAVQAQNRKAK